MNRGGLKAILSIAATASRQGLSAAAAAAAVAAAPPQSLPAFAVPPRPAHFTGAASVLVMALRTSPRKRAPPAGSAAPDKAKSKSESPAKRRRSAVAPAPADVNSVRLVSSDLAAVAPDRPWVDLEVSPEELRPSATLTTGQSFSWIVVHDDDGDGDGGPAAASPQKQSAWGSPDETEWVGPLGDRVFAIRETPVSTLYRILHGPPEGAGDVLRDYFQLGVPLAPLYKEWSKGDRRMARIADVVPGVRILRQDPVECLFSFICSSNNNIPRITKMLAAFRERYGDLLAELPGRLPGDGDGSHSRTVRRLYSFPTLDALQGSTEADLREMGLGYRAKFVIATRDLLLDSGGERYLLGLREKDDAGLVQEELVRFSGIGRKVADCVALFSLDQTDAIPVDVHVWHIACREYDPTLGEAKSLTPTVYGRVGDHFRSRFPSHAGWGHSLLFVAELPSFRSVLPTDIVAQMDEWREQEQARKAAKKAEKKSKAKKSEKVRDAKVNGVTRRRSPSIEKTIKTKHKF